MKNTSALSGAAMALLLTTSVASAGVIKFDVSATLTPSVFPGGGACAPTCTLGADLVINNSPPDPGTFISANITATGFSPSVGPFTTLFRIGTFGGDTTLEIDDAVGDVLHLAFLAPTPGSLVEYTGGTLAIIPSSPFVSGVLTAKSVGLVGWDITSGSLTATAATLEPSTWALMALGFAGLGYAAYRRRRSAVAVAH